MRTIIFAVIFLLALSGRALASTGFVDEPLWLSPEKPKDGEMATLTAVFRNGETETLSGTISFFDGSTLLAKRSVSIAPNQVASSSVTFRMGSGRHEFSAAMQPSGEASAVISPSSAKVSLPSVLVPKNFLAAKADDTPLTGDAAAQREILDQVDKAEQAVLGLLPEPVKESVSGVVQTVEDWREVRSDTYAESRDDAKLEVEKEKLEAAKAGKAAGGTAVEKKPHAGPMTYTKLLFYSVLAFIFSPFGFYLIGGVLAFLILRFFVLKIVRALRMGRARSARPKKPVPQKGH